jgi:YidC/Oxa1 family membrane protein insertase
MELMQPKTDDPAQQQSNLILKVLPIMIGWFALSVPSALSVYWFVNNIVTTGLALWIKNSMSVELPKSPGGAATMEAPAQTIFAPIREKPAGFGEVQATARDDGVKPITVMDAEIVDDSRDSEEREDETGGKKQRRKSRKKKKKN